MSTAMVSTSWDVNEVFRKNNLAYTNKMKVGEQKSVPQLTIRRTSTPVNSLASCFANNRLTDTMITLAMSEAASALLNNQTTSGYKKLDRSLSEPVQPQTQKALPPTSSTRYKTELCRPYEENGTCKYGDKCQFAHGAHDLRTLSRHPKYKTELCRTFHTIGFCPYGPRCHFIHNADEPATDVAVKRPKALSLRNSTGNSFSSPPDCNSGRYNRSVSIPTTSNAFTYNSQSLALLLSQSVNQRVQEQNAFNSKLNKFNLWSNEKTRRSLDMINDSDSVFSDVPSPGLSSPPLPSRPSSTSTDSQSLASSDELSVCGSPTAHDTWGIFRLPIFSQLSNTDD